MNKELEDAIKVLEKLKDELDKLFNITYINNTKERNVIEIILNYIENSISKETIKEKIEELSNTKGDFATYITTSERIKVLEELLEGK